MKALDLYNQLENDFIKPSMSDNWFDYMTTPEEYLCDNFKQRSFGVMCDFTEEINKIYTSVFPSEFIFSKILDESICDAMLFVHHASVWDLSKTPGMFFHQMNPELLEKLRERRISIFCFHTPLDGFGEYSTSKTLADAISIKIDKPFIEHSGALVGVIGTTNCANTQELNMQYSQAVGHETKLYPYGKNEITNNRIAVVAGGGCHTFIINELIKNGIDVLVTGVSTDACSKEAHELAKENGICILGGTHYSSEMFACIAMCKYFEKLGFTSEFISDTPCLEDL